MMPALIPLDAGQAVAFWICAPIMLLAGVGMLAARRAVHSALFLATIMVCLAVLYASLGAPFLAAAQIIVYTGAILMLFLFVVMLVGVDVRESMVETIKGQRWAAIIAALGLAVLLVGVLGHAIVGKPVGVEAASAAAGGNVQAVANKIFSDYVFAFEATSALLITAALGAMVMAHYDRLAPKTTQADLQTARIRRYATEGEHPGALPAPGVFARSTAINTPALLPDGTPSQRSISATLQTREHFADPAQLAAPTQKAFEEIERTKQGELEA